MSWDNTQPTNNTKIRNLGVVIRPNWVAIEEADHSFQPHAINLANRTSLTASNDPQKLNSAYLLYCKEDASGNPQLFGMDAKSNVMQFSKEPPTIEASGSLFLPGGLFLKWGQFTFKGKSTTQNFSSVFPTASLCVVTTPTNEEAAVCTWGVVGWNASGFTLRTGGVKNASFSYFAIGY